MKQKSKQATSLAKKSSTPKQNNANEIPFGLSDTMHTDIEADGVDCDTSSTSILEDTEECFAILDLVEFHLHVKTSAAKIVFATEKPENATHTIDLSMDKNGTVLAWIFDLECVIYPANGAKMVMAPTDSSSMFEFYTALKTVDLSGLDTSNVSDISRMFRRCIALENLDLSVIDTVNVVDIYMMFEGCEKLINLNISNWDVRGITSKAYAFLNTSDDLVLVCSMSSEAFFTFMSGTHFGI